MLTSGNVSDEPIAFDDDDAAERLAGIADAFLVHDRAIHTRVDDSVVRVVARAGAAAPPLAGVRARAAAGCRGQSAAAGARLRRRAEEHVLPGARAARAFVSQHIGDLENYETLPSFTDGIEHLRRLFDVEPEVVAHDLHPDYLSTQVRPRPATGVELVGVQHHHAHIASCLADNGAAGPVIGVAFDGLGYGTDGTALGRRVPGRRPGGLHRASGTWRRCRCRAGRGHPAALADGRGAPGRRVRADRPAGGSPSSRGRADRWEQVARAGPRPASNAPLDLAAPAGCSTRSPRCSASATPSPTRARPRSSSSSVPTPREHRRLPGRVVPVTRPASSSGRRRPGPGGRRGPRAPATGARCVAARFHNGLADVVVEVCERLRDGTACPRSPCPAGCSRTRCCSRAAVDGLEDAGFTVLTHRRVPPNDGGISLGQAAVAVDLLRSRRPARELTTFGMRGVASAGLHAY